MKESYAEKCIKETLLAHKFDQVRIDNFKDGLSTLYMKKALTLGEFGYLLGKINTWTAAYRAYQCPTFSMTENVQ